MLKKIYDLFSFSFYGKKRKEAVIRLSYHIPQTWIWNGLKKEQKKVKTGLWSTNKTASPNSKHFNTLALLQKFYVEYTFPNFSLLQSGPQCYTIW